MFYHSHSATEKAEGVRRISTTPTFNQWVARSIPAGLTNKIDMSWQDNMLQVRLLYAASRQIDQGDPIYDCASYLLAGDARMTTTVSQPALRTCLARFIHEGEGVLGFRVGSPGVAGCG